MEEKELAAIRAERKQLFIEAYSDALVKGIEGSPDRTKLVFGLDDVPVLVKQKMRRIESAPEKFEVENAVVAETCAALHITHERAAILGYLDGKPTAPQEEPLTSGIVKLIRIDCAQGDVQQVIEYGEQLGASGGALVMHPIYGYEVPEFEVPDEKVVSFCKGFEEAGLTAMRLSEPTAVGS